MLTKQGPHSLTPLYLTSITNHPHTQSNSISAAAFHWSCWVRICAVFSAERLCILRVYWEYSRSINIWWQCHLSSAPQAQADDLLTFRHPGPDELLRAELSVTSAGPAPGGIERQGYLWSHLAQMSIARPPPADWTLRPRGKGDFVRSAELSLW